MRSGLVLLVLSSLAFASCAQRAAARVAGDGEFVLELGGAGRSLATSLKNCKVELLPAPEPLPAPVVETEPPAKDPVRTPSPKSESEREVPPDPLRTLVVAPQDAAANWFEVELGPQETLMDVASKHLGSAKRFKEIMTLNGFTDRDTRRLKAGTRIKVPKAAGGAAR